MKVAQWVRGSLVGIVLSTCICLPAHAVVNVIEPVTQPVTDVNVVSFLYSFASIVGQSYSVTLSDFGSPAPFDGVNGLTANITEGSTLIKHLNATGASDSWTFQALQPQTSVTVFALAGLLPGSTRPAYASQFYLTVTQVPEPAVWLMMIGGIGLLGWLRLRKSENLA